MSAVRERLRTYRHGGALFGIAARRAVGLYLVVSALIMLLLLVTAWAIDLARNFDDVQAKAAEDNVWLGTVLLPYLFYRAVDIVTRLLPVACFIGLFVAETIRRQRLETIILAAAGVSPLQGLAAVAAFGLIAGGIQTGLEAFWRPAAVFAQVEADLGQYANRFRPGLKSGSRWFVSGSDAIRAQVLATGEPELQNVELYRGFTGTELDQIIVARRAVPMETGKLWRLEHAIKCEGSSGSSCAAVPGGTLDIELDLSPAQLTYLDIPGFYLPNDALAQVAEMRMAPNVADIDLAVWRRMTAILLPGAFALLGASLAQIVWSGRVQSPVRMVSICFAGYAMIVSNKVFWSLGEIGAVSAPFAALAPIALALAGTAIVQIWRSGGFAPRQERLALSSRAAAIRG